MTRPDDDRVREPNGGSTWLPWLTALALAVFQCTLIAGFWNQLDLHVVDEITYLKAGLDFAGGDIGALSYVYSPVLSLIYASLSILPHGSVPLPDVMFVLLAVSSTLSFYWALRPIAGEGAAALIGIWWAASAIAVQHVLPLMVPSVYTLGAALGALVLGCLYRGWWVRALLAFTLLALNRPEGILWMFLFGVAALACNRRRTEESRAPRRTGMAAIVIAGLLVGGHYFSVEKRGFFAFSQHYALGNARGAAERMYAFDRHEEITRRDFPTAQSIAGAALENPSALAAHAWRNCRQLTSSLMLVWISPFSARNTHALLLPSMWWLGFLVLNLALAIPGAARWKHRKEKARAGASTNLHLAFLAGSISVLIASVLLASRPDHLAPLAIPFYYFVACLLGSGLASLHGRWLRGTAGVMPVVTILLLALLVPRPYEGPDAAMPQRAALQLIRKHLRPEMACNLEGPFAMAYAALLERSNLATNTQEQRPGQPTYWIGEGSSLGEGWQLIERSGAMALYRRTE